MLFYLTFSVDKDVDHLSDTKNRRWKQFWCVNSGLYQHMQFKDYVTLSTKINIVLPPTTPKIRILNENTVKPTIQWCIPYFMNITIGI